MKSIEQEPIDQFCPAYFEHLMQGQLNNKPSALARIFGIFAVGFSKGNKNKAPSSSGVAPTSGSASSPPPAVKSMNQTSGKLFMVMENLFYGHTINKIYDLKGNTSNRTTKEGPNVTVRDSFYFPYVVQCIQMVSCSV